MKDQKHEFPSGQAENRNLYSEAIKELQEETSISIKKKEIKKLEYSNDYILKFSYSKLFLL